MSASYGLWKWKGTGSISRGLCYCLLLEGSEIPEVEILDTDEVKIALSRAFPELYDQKSESSFSCEVLPTGLILETYSSTPEAVLKWFVDFAAKRGFEFFDPQSEEITDIDEQQCNDRIEKVKREQEEDERPLLESKARKGDPKALVELGNRYAFGEGVAVDYSKAYAYYLEAAAQNHVDGIFNVAACYHRGEGVRQDIQEAIRWYVRAMEQDKYYAPYVLGEIYASGEGVPVDPKRAIEYLQIALANGNSEAKILLRTLGALPPAKGSPNQAL